MRTDSDLGGIGSRAFAGYVAEHSDECIEDDDFRRVIAGAWRAAAYAIRAAVIEDQTAPLKAPTYSKAGVYR